MRLAGAVMEPIALDPEDLVWLNGSGLRVHPKGTIHTASCRTQNWVPGWPPPLALPWPRYADDDDRPCKICKPNVDEPRTLDVEP